MLYNMFLFFRQNLKRERKKEKKQDKTNINYYL